MSIHNDEFTVPAGAPRWITAELLADTMRVWGRYYEDLTTDDAVSIIENVGRLYDILRRRDNEEVRCACAC
jgi:hypothetical protein